MEGNLLAFSIGNASAMRMQAISDLIGSTTAAPGAIEPGTRARQAHPFFAFLSRECDAGLFVLYIWFV